MERSVERRKFAGYWVIAAVAAAGVGCGATPSGGADGGTDGGEVVRTVKSSGAWTVYADPYGDGGTNPATGITGAVEAVELKDGKTRFTLSVSGVASNRMFGSHLHKLACNDNKGGGHYQNTPSTTTATDPAYANAQNEVWLDFTTDMAGAGQAQTTVSWVPRTGEAKSVVIHNAHTNPADGTAGPKLACIELAF